MAKNLEPGDTVTVKAPVSLDKTSNAYKQGLEHIEPSSIGKVIEHSTGRSAIVEFNGIPVTLSTQRLTKVEPAKRGRPKGTAQRPEKPVLLPPQTFLEPTQPQSETYGSEVITIIANKLLASGAVNPERETIIELRFADFPNEVQEHILALIRAKLALTL